MEKLSNFGKDKERIYFDVLVLGHIAELHNYLTQTDSYFQTIKGIRALVKSGYHVVGHTVVVKPNYRYLKKIASLVISLGIKKHRFTFVQPKGLAEKNFDSIVPFMSLVSPHIVSAINLLEKYNVKVELENFVPCLVDGRDDLIVKYAKGVKLDACKKCTYHSCPGAPEWYVKQKANDEFGMKSLFNALN